MGQELSLYSFAYLCGRNVSPIHNWIIFMDHSKVFHATAWCMMLKCTADCLQEILGTNIHWPNVLKLLVLLTSFLNRYTWYHGFQIPSTFPPCLLLDFQNSYCAWQKYNWLLCMLSWLLQHGWNAVKSRLSPFLRIRPPGTSPTHKMVSDK